MNMSGYPDPTAEKAIARVMKENRRKRKKMDLMDTVALMASKDYKARFKAEYYQLKIRYHKLKVMVDAWDNLSFTPTCSRQTYCLQLEAMRSYINILDHRAKAEGIILENV